MRLVSQPVLKILSCVCSSPATQIIEASNPFTPTGQPSGRYGLMHVYEYFELFTSLFHLLVLVCQVCLYMCVISFYKGVYNRHERHTFYAVCCGHTSPIAECPLERARSSHAKKNSLMPSERETYTKIIAAKLAGHSKSPNESIWDKLFPFAPSERESRLVGCFLYTHTFGP